MPKRAPPLIEDLEGNLHTADALFDLTPQLTQALASGQRASPTAAAPQPAVGTVRLHLPRWDTAWEIKTNRRGWPVVDPKTGKVVKHRPVWDTLRGNSRYGHWAKRHKMTRLVIDEVTRSATDAGLRPCRFLTVELVWAPGWNTVADEDNLYPLLKVCCDALARGRNDLPGLHLVPDDTSRCMRKQPRILWPPTPAGLWLDVTPDYG